MNVIYYSVFMRIDMEINDRYFSNILCLYNIYLAGCKFLKVIYKILFFLCRKNYY